MLRSCWDHFQHKHVHGGLPRVHFCAEGGHQLDISWTSAGHQLDIIGKGHRQWTNCREQLPRTSIPGRENGCRNTLKQVQGESCFRHSLSHQSHTFAFQPPLPLTKMPTLELISPKAIFFAPDKPKKTK